MGHLNGANLSSTPTPAGHAPRGGELRDGRVRNYVTDNPSNLGNYVTADSCSCSFAESARNMCTKIGLVACYRGLRAYRADGLSAIGVQIVWSIRRGSRQIDRCAQLATTPRSKRSRPQPTSDRPKATRS